uniref:hypothetical protein n=1 Tax=Streptomyces violaceoruber TaxID=1935 RepID=UPI00155DBB2A|nr:hypothetical protein [Streptomyces violaceoruber]
MANDRQALHQLAEREDRIRHRATQPGPTILQLDAMSPDQFDLAVRQALEQSGFKTALRGPRTIEAATRDGALGLIFCASVQNPAPDATTDVRAILTARRLAAALELGVLVISNLKFISRPANSLLNETTSVRLVQRLQLQEWIEWGVPVQDVLVSA